MLMSDTMLLKTGCKLMLIFDIPSLENERTREKRRLTCIPTRQNSLFKVQMVTLPRVNFPTPLGNLA